MKKVGWIKILKAITAESKYFKAWQEDDPDEPGKQIGCLFAHDAKRAILVKNHGLFAVETGVYALCNGEPVLCAEDEHTRKVEAFLHDRLLVRPETQPSFFATMSPR